MQHNWLAICLDSGDTLVDEGTEGKDARGIVQTAQLIPTAAELVQGLKLRGYRLALVADGPVGTFENVLGRQYGLLSLFDALAISETVGVHKPDPAMFRHALAALNVDPAAYHRVLMVGNNLSRDIRGANQLGLTTVWLDWSPRRSKTPADDLEIPDHTIHLPVDLLTLLDQGLYPPDSHR